MSMLEHCIVWNSLDRQKFPSILGKDTNLLSIGMTGRHSWLICFLRQQVQLKFFSALACVGSQMQQPICSRKDQHFHKISKWTSGSTWAQFCTSNTNQWNTGKLRDMLEDQLLKAGEVDNKALDHAMHWFAEFCLGQHLILMQRKETCSCQKIRLQQYYVVPIFW